ncbi:MAG: alpha/beta hydrolase [Crocosphaera sp.]|nr:alpha/beta hydrolase [Crocosphaera sp.]
MNLKGEIIAYHGWGFDRNCWKKWQEILSNNFQFKTYDRGYFGDDNSPQFNNISQKIKIIFAHSYGLHFCPVETLKKATLLILFNSFSEFHPENEKQRKRSKYGLKLMIDEFKNKPKTVLASFYQKCYYPFPSIEPNYKNFNWERLEQDLNRLNISKLDINILKKLSKIYIIHGLKDRIMIASHAQEFYKKLSQNSQYYEIKEAGHTLPFTNIKSCLSIVNQALGEIDNYGTD